MTKIETFDIPSHIDGIRTQVEKAIRDSWLRFIEEVTPDHSLQYHFLSSMKNFDDAFTHATIIDNKIIKTLLGNILKPFPIEKKKLIENKFYELLYLYSPKVKSDSRNLTSGKPSQSTELIFSQVWLDNSFDSWTAILKDNSAFNPILANDNSYIGGKKGKRVLVAWFFAARAKGKISKDLTQIEMAEISMNTFPKLEIGHRTFDGKKDRSFIGLVDTIKKLFDPS